MIGIFPVTYVEIIPNESVGSLSRNNRTKEPATSPEGKGKAKFNFQAQTPMELSLIKGKNGQFPVKIVDFRFRIWISNQTNSKLSLLLCLRKLGPVCSKYTESFHEFFESKFNFFFS